MRKLLLILLSMIILTSCSAFDNQANNQEVKDIKKQAVYDAFSNYSSVSNKSYNKFALPQSIEISEIKNAYMLDCNSPKNSISNDTVLEIYKAFYGEKYNNNNVTYDDNDGILYSAGENTSTYWGYDISLFSDDYYSYETDSAKQYDAFTDKDESISFRGKTITIQSLSDEINSGLKNILSPFYPGYDIKVESLSILGDNVEFTCSLSKDNISFQYAPSEYLSYDNNNMTYWLFSSVSGIYGINGFKMIQASPQNIITDSSAISEIVPIDEAVAILDKELAENIDFEFTDIRLMYCCLTAQPIIDRMHEEKQKQSEEDTEEYNMKTKEYVPMWCFEIQSTPESISKQYIKINAVTGEMFVDMGR